jgi:hypothetical protein
VYRREDIKVRQQRKNREKVYRRENIKVRQGFQCECIFKHKRKLLLEMRMVAELTTHANITATAMRLIGAVTKLDRDCANAHDRAERFRYLELEFRRFQHIVDEEVPALDALELRVANELRQIRRCLGVNRQDHPSVAGTLSDMSALGSEAKQVLSLVSKEAAGLHPDRGSK